MDAQTLTQTPKRKDIEALVDKLINELIDSDSSTVDTLALMLNKKARREIAQGLKEIDEGKRIPFEDVLK